MPNRSTSKLETTFQIKDHLLLFGHWTCALMLRLRTFWLLSDGVKGRARWGEEERWKSCPSRTWNPTRNTSLQIAQTTFQFLVWSFPTLWGIDLILMSWSETFWLLSDSQSLVGGLTEYDSPSKARLLDLVISFQPLQQIKGGGKRYYRLVLILKPPESSTSWSYIRRQW